MRRHYRNHPQSPAAEDGSGWSSASPLPGPGLQIIGYATPATAAAANGTSSDEDDSPMEIDVPGRRGRTLSWEPYTPDWYEQKYKEEGYMSGRRGS
ncbi:hypothetical protein EWM64_g6027 [Hericium alpestre]|uniref:Uncharacterized protein n=1 Tax=Hericium alpestre TaxID=135208 RepID=A0A4Y9ZSW8_9AGAM|nr:hypothetical protein EWM64_g6027 [Hericium alpestre]